MAGYPINKGIGHSVEFKGLFMGGKGKQGG